MFFTVGNNYEGKRCIIFEELFDDMITVEDKRMKIEIVDETVSQYICKPSMIFWGHWNGVYKDIMKKNGLQVRPSQRNADKQSNDWDVIIPKKGVDLCHSE